MYKIQFMASFITKMLMLLLSASLVLQAQAAVDTGKPALDFTLKDMNGKAVSLSDYRGKTVVLEWTNHECPFVKKHYESGNMQALQKKYTEKGVVWLSVISSAPGEQGYVLADKAAALTGSRNAHPSNVLFDPEGEVGHLYGALTTPHMYIIDSEGVLVYNGAIDSIRSKDQADVKKAINYVEAALQAVLAGKAVELPLTRPYGCSIKYKKITL